MALALSSPHTHPHRCLPLQVIGAMREWWGWLPKTKAPGMAPSVAAVVAHPKEASSGGGGGGVLQREVYLAMATLIQEVRPAGTPPPPVLQGPAEP